MSAVIDTSDPARRAGAVTLNDMKDMLANLPQFQDLREKVRIIRLDLNHRLANWPSS